MEPNSGIGIGLGILASKDILNKILGPTADYIGEGIKNLVKKSNENLERILKDAYKKLGSKIETNGKVNSRVFKNIWDEGRFVEDELAAEYFGGILASSRSDDGKDDRGLSLISTVRDLSVFELRFHYLIYRSIRSLFLGNDFTIAVQEDRVNTGIYMPFRVYQKAIGLKDLKYSQDIAAHSLITLIKYELIDHRFILGPIDKIKSYCKTANEPGIILIPSFFGAELYLWAHGLSEISISKFLDKEIDIVSSIPMEIDEGIMPLTLETKTL